jgi:3-oxosteroid 1-dehydrogenase
LAGSNYSDVVVVGSGAAGLTAALTAARRGAATILLERAPVFGGTTAISGGGLWIPCNPFMAERGFADTTTEVEAYLRKVTLGLVAEDVIQAFIRLAPEAFDYLASETPVEFLSTDTPDYQANYPGARNMGRQVSTGLYDTSRLGEHRALLRSLSPGAIPPVRHSEQQERGWGIAPGEFGNDLANVAEQRRRDGIAGRGNALVGGLLEACIAAGVELIPNTRALSLIESDGVVTGAEAEREGRREIFRSRRGVILASGGYEWNRLLWNGFNGGPLDIPLSPPHNEGDAIRMAGVLGARFEHTSMAWWMPSIMLQGEEVDGKRSGRMFTWDKMLPGAIVVNRAGRRFGNEAMNYNDFGMTMTAFDPARYEFPNLPAWVVMDNDHYEIYKVGEAAAAYGSEWLTTASSPRELARKIGVDEVGLENELTEFSRHAEHGDDPKFQRGMSAWEVYRADPQYANPAVRPFGSGPFHAYRQYLGCLGTKGGPAFDADARVLNYDDKPIQGLYAVGNAAASPFGPAYPGAGATLGPGVAFGYAAALAATP